MLPVRPEARIGFFDAFRAGHRYRPGAERGGCRRRHGDAVISAGADRSAGQALSALDDKPVRQLRDRTAEPPEQLRRALQAVGLLEPEPRGILNDRLALRASRRHGQHGDQIRNLGGVDADTAQCAPSDRDARAGYLGLRAEAAQNVQNGAVALRGRQAQSLHAHAAL